MAKYHKIFSVLLGLLYIVTLQVFSSPVPVFRFLLPAFSGLLAITFFYNRWYLKTQNKYNFWILIRPLLLQTSGFLMFLFLLNSFFRGIFLVATVFLIAAFEIMAANFSENLMLNESLIIAFGFCFSFFGFVWWFPSFSYLYFAGLFLGLFFVARCFYEFLPQTPRSKTLNALVVSFLSAQVFWAASSLPFHYSVLAILVLNFFYMTLVLNYHSLFYALTSKKIKFYLGIFGLTVLLVFAATPWSVIDR